MKNVIIMFSIITLVVLGNIVSQNILEKDGEILTNKLQELSKELQFENRKEKMEEIYNLWEEIEEKWSIIVTHQELDLIKTSILEAKAGIDRDDLDFSYEQIQNSIFLVGHIKEKTAIKWKNVF